MDIIHQTSDLFIAGVMPWFWMGFALGMTAMWFAKRGHK